MKTLVTCLMMVFIVSSIPSVLISQDRERPEASRDWMTLQHTIQEVLNGDPLSAYSAGIAPGAQLVAGDKMLDLAAAVAAKNVNLLLQDQKKRPEGVGQKMDCSGDAAYLSFKVERDSKMRYHTVVFMKDSAGTWAVENWHVSPAVP